jgi:hypothetical protein
MPAGLLLLGGGDVVERQTAVGIARAVERDDATHEEEDELRSAHVWVRHLLPLVPPCNHVSTT